MTTNSNDEAQEVLHALFSSESSSDETEDEDAEQLKNAPPPIPEQEAAPSTIQKIQMMLTELVKTHRDSLIAALQDPVKTGAKKTGDEYVAQARAAILFKSVSLNYCTGQCTCDPERVKDLKTLSWERYNQNAYNNKMYKSTSAKEGDKVTSETMTDPGSRRMWRDLFILSNLISAFQQMRAITTASTKTNSMSLDSVSRVLISICNDCDIAFIVGAPIELVNFLIALAERVASDKGVELVDPSAMAGKPKSNSLDSIAYIMPSKLPPKASLPKYADMASIATLRIAPSSAVFGRLYLHKRTPVIIRNATDGWPAMKRWPDLSYLLRQYGHRIIPIEVGRHHEGVWRERSLSMATFIRQFLLPSNQRSADGRGSARVLSKEELLQVGYLAQHQLFDQLPSLKRDFSVPGYCDDLGKLSNINAWLGTCGTVSPLHFDGYDNLLVQVCGFKYVRLYDTDQTPFLYCSRGTGTRAQNNISAVQIEQPDLEKFPQFQRARGSEAILCPGDMLFIPRGCWHYLRSLSTSFSINFWF